jgi:polysaccharide chain length determinant protein (PEP-CTERM system associated)
MNLQEIIAEILNHLRGMWRYRWHAVVVAWLVAIPGWSAVYKMPDIFQASAQVSVDTNSLLPALTQGLTAGENIIDEVDLVSRVLLTRPNLTEVARKTDLDLRAGTPQEMELLITSIQKRVGIRSGRDNVFEITFQDRDRQKASDVVATLLNTFVESSLGAQGKDVDMTERAIRAEIKDHEDRLVRSEADLADFKRRNLGYMPDDGADYYTRLQALLSSVATTISIAPHEWLREWR